MVAKSPHTLVINGGRSRRGSTPTRLKGQRRSARGHVLDDVIGSDDPGRRDQVRLANTARLGAGTARPELPAVVEKLADDILERWEAFFLDFVGVAIRGQSNSLDGQQNHRLLVGRGRDVAENEGQRGALRVLLAMCRVHQNFRHVCSPFPVSCDAGPYFLRIKNRARCDSLNVASSSLPVSRLQAGMPSWAAGSSLMTSSTCPLCSSRRRWRMNGVRSPQPVWPRSTVASATMASRASICAISY